MAWPQATDYLAALQNPSNCFRDDELRSGEAAVDAVLGLPLTYSGNFASVFKVSRPDGAAWAVKCFTRPVTDLQERYSRHQRTPRPAEAPVRRRVRLFYPRECASAARGIRR